jgi:hypothetical protein
LELIGTGGSVGWFGAGDDCERGRAFSDVIEAERIADVGQLSGIQLFFPLSRGYRGEAPGADGVEAAIWITPVGKAWSWKGGHRTLLRLPKWESVRQTLRILTQVICAILLTGGGAFKKKVARRSVRTGRPC